MRLDAVTAASDAAASDDAELIVRARAGDNDAFGVLWRRHADAVTRAARSFTGYDADDVASEAFVRVLRQVRAGGGPDTEPRAYLIRTARNVATEWARRDAGGATAELDEEQLDELATPDHADRVAQREAARAAFERLPERWRQALWHREVEDLAVADCARLMGTTPNTATVTLKRAREGFAQEWIRENVARRGASEECAWVTQRLPRYARGKSTNADAQRVTRHLAQCRACALSGAEARNLHERLALVLLPALFAAPGVHALLQPGSGADAAAAATASRRVLGRLNRRSVVVGGVAASAAVAAVVATVALAGAMSTASGPGAFPENPTDAPVAAEPVDEAEPTPEPTPTPDGAPQPKPTPTRPGGQATTAPETPASAAPVVTERPLAVSPVSAAPGVYPQLSGTATPGAIVRARFTAGAESVTVQTTAAASGAWSLAPHTLAGTITTELEQSYTDAAGQTVVVAGPTGVVFTVQQLVSGFVTEIVEGTSALNLAGPAGATIEVDSPVPGISGSYTLDGAGVAVITMPAPKWEAGPVRFRLVSGGRTGPWASWG